MAFGLDAYRQWRAVCRGRRPARAVVGVDATFLFDSKFNTDAGRLNYPGIWLAAPTLSGNRPVRMAFFPERYEAAADPSVTDPERAAHLIGPAS